MQSFGRKQPRADMWCRPARWFGASEKVGITPLLFPILQLPVGTWELELETSKVNLSSGQNTVLNTPFLTPWMDWCLIDGLKSRLWTNLRWDGFQTLSYCLFLPNVVQCSISACFIFHAFISCVSDWASPVGFARKTEFCAFVRSGKTQKCNSIGYWKWMVFNYYWALRVPVKDRFCFPLFGYWREFPSDYDITQFGSVTKSTVFCCRKKNGIATMKDEMEARILWPLTSFVAVFLSRWKSLLFYFHNLEGYVDEIKVDCNLFHCQIIKPQQSAIQMQSVKLSKNAVFYATRLVFSRHNYIEFTSVLHAPGINFTCKTL